MPLSLSSPPPDMIGGVVATSDGGTTLPASPEAVRYGLGQPLDTPVCSPGTPAWKYPLLTGDHNSIHKILLSLQDVDYGRVLAALVALVLPRLELQRLWLRFCRKADDFPQESYVGRHDGLLTTEGPFLKLHNRPSVPIQPLTASSHIGAAQEKLEFRTKLGPFLRPFSGGLPKTVPPSHHGGGNHGRQNSVSDSVAPSPASAAANANSPASSRSKQTPVGKRRMRDDGNGDEPEEAEPRKKRPKAKSLADPLSLACPYYKRNPRAHGASPCCGPRGWPSVHRLKEHLYDNHNCYRCSRCHTLFQTKTEYNEHGRLQPACITSDKPEFYDDYDQGFDEKQHKELKSRKLRREVRRKADLELVGQEGEVEKEYWTEIWGILFPDLKHNAPSPLYDHEGLLDFQSFKFEHRWSDPTLRQRLGGVIGDHNVDRVIELFGQSDQEMMSRYQTVRSSLTADRPGVSRHSAPPQGEAVAPAPAPPAREPGPQLPLRIPQMQQAQQAQQAYLPSGRSSQNPGPFVTPSPSFIPQDPFASTNTLETPYWGWPGSNTFPSGPSNFQPPATYFPLLQQPQYQTHQLPQPQQQQYAYIDQTHQPGSACNRGESALGPSHPTLDRGTLEFDTSAHFAAPPHTVSEPAVAFPAFDRTTTTTTTTSTNDNHDDVDDGNGGSGRGLPSEYRFDFDGMLYSGMGSHMQLQGMDGDLVAPATLPVDLCPPGTGGPGAPSHTVVRAIENVDSQLSSQEETLHGSEH